MALTRKHFTALAEFIGGVEAGRIAPGDARQALIESLLQEERNFKRDKFDVHATKQRDEFERCEARDLIQGDTFERDGLIFRADRIRQMSAGTADACLVIKTFVDSASEDGDIVEFILAPEDIV